MQSFERWYPVPDVPSHLAVAVALQSRGDEWRVICGPFSSGQCLVLCFDTADALLAQEECEHRWEPEEGLASPPKSGGGEYTFPFLKIRDSAWAAGSRRAQYFGQTPTHFCVVSLDCIVDILSVHPPQVRWMALEELDAMVDRIQALGDP